MRCFRDEDLRADRQPEFTQIDCEMSFVEQEDVLEVFERWAKHMFHEVLGLDFREPLRRMPWIEAMEKYGSDKPDLRFGMEFFDLTDLAKGHGFSVFDEAEYVTGFAATGCATYTRKQIDALTEYVKRPQVGPRAHLDPRRRERHQVLDRQVLHSGRGARDGRPLRCEGR